MKMSKNVIFYQLEDCSTCQKAKRYLERHDIRDFQARDIKENPLSRAEVANLSEMLGDANELFSRRTVKYREMKLSERELSRAEMIDLMAGDYAFLKRPILVIGDKAVAGFFEKQFADFIYKYYFEK